jgi:hypothetical protein
MTETSELVSSARPRAASQRLLKVQAVSGAVFAVFLTAHLVNTALAVLGPGAYDRAQRATRAVYQAPLLELVLVALPLVVHVGAAVVRLLWFRAPVASGPWRVRLFRLAGRFLLLVIAGHVAATRGASLVGGLSDGPRFEGLAFTFAWHPLWFWPYYVLLGVAGVLHLGHGLSVGARLWGRPMLEGWRFGAAVGVGSVLVVAGLIALGAGLFDVGDPMTSAYARWVLSW